MRDNEPTLTMSRAELVTARVLGVAARLAVGLPTFARLALFGTPPRNDRGDALDDATHVLAKLDEWALGALSQPEIEVSRTAMRRGTASVAKARPPSVVVRATSIAGRPARAYFPATDGKNATKPPLLVFFHGGGWAVGDLDTHDSLCARIAADAGWAVLSVDYRLAPEHPCPAPFDDAIAAFRAAPAWAADAGVATTGIAVGGDSAGGNLSAAVSVATRDAGETMPALQLLIYPALDLRRLTPSHTSCAAGPLLTSADIDHFLKLFAAPDITELSVSPGLVADVAGLPTTIITSAGFDPLRDEAEAFAERLSAAGVDVTHLHAPTLAHGYASMDGAVAAADVQVGLICQALRRHHS